jgi:hypothetical protein
MKQTNPETKIYIRKGPGGEVEVRYVDGERVFLKKIKAGSKALLRSLKSGWYKAKLHFGNAVTEVRPLKQNPAPEYFRVSTRRVYEVSEDSAQRKKPRATYTKRSTALKHVNPFRVSTRRVYKVTKESRQREKPRATYTERSTALKHVNVKRKRKNPNEDETLIYGRLMRIEAQKTQPHRCDAACRRARHQYFHDFKKGSEIWGLPDGSLVVRKVK